MNSSLRKLAASVVLDYADGSHAQTLVGSNFSLDKKDEGFSLYIDLSNNLAGRNRGLLCFYEAQGLVRQHDKVTSIHLKEKGLVLALGREIENIPSVEIVLSLGENQRFTYTATPAITPAGMTFSIQAAPEKASIPNALPRRF